MPKTTERGVSYAGHVDVSPADTDTPDWTTEPESAPEPEPERAPAPAPRTRRRTRGGAPQETP